MNQTYFFYDLETSGLNPRDHRIMQFAGIRTDKDLKPIGKPYNLLVKLNDDILPSPDALMVTGISPQKTLDEGYSEAEFAKILAEEIFTPNTITIGFNNVRFDDEFIRHLFWRNFHDAYEWSWKDGRSRWDILDVVRMTRALRPEGIKWPVDSEGKATNRLELLTKENNLVHLKAHDALSDVEALIAVTAMIKDKQPQLFDYLLSMRDKKQVQKLANLDNKQPFVYTSGRYDEKFAKTTVAFPLTAGRNSNLVVYDLRHDPTEFFDLSISELEAKLFAPWEERQKEGFVVLPVKEFKANQAPAIAPLSVLQKDDGWERVGLSSEIVAKHQKALMSRPDFAEKIRTIYENAEPFKKQAHVEGQLYDGFLTDKDRKPMLDIRSAGGEKLADFHPNFVDERLSKLLLHYKARNFPKSLSQTEAQEWEDWRSQRIKEQWPEFLKGLQKYSGQELSEDKAFILEELKLWAENVMPSDD